MSSLNEVIQEFDIDLAEIWNFEKTDYNNELSLLSHDQIEDLIEKMVNLRVKLSEPLVVRSEDKGVGYWSQKYNEYRQFKNEKDPFSTDLILTNKGIYTHHNSLIVSNDKTDEFDYWFTIGLKHFSDNLKNVSNFLNYHLNVSFNSDFKKYYEFLEYVVLQFENTFLSIKIISEIRKYCVNGSMKVKVKKTRKPPREKNSRKMGKPRDSYELDKDIQGVNDLIQDVNTWIDLSRKLKDGLHLHEGTHYSLFKRLLTNRKFEEKDRIEWVGSDINLKRFIEYFLYDKKLILDCGNEQWFIAQKCFLFEGRESIEIDKLKLARGGKKQTNNEITELLDTIFSNVTYID